MDYEQYHSLSNFGIQSLHQQPQSQSQHQKDQQSQRQAQDQGQQFQPQEQEQRQGQVQQVHQLPQLRQEQVQQLQQQYFRSPQRSQAELSIPSFAAPQPSPWDSPLDSLGTPTPTSAFGFSDAQLAAAMNMVASAGVSGGYSQVQQDSLLPPITTLEMMDPPALTPNSGTSAATPGSASTASPVTVRTEVPLQDTQGQAQAKPQAQLPYEPQDEPKQVQYQPPQVIQLVERPQRKSWARARANQQTPRAQVQARKQNQRESQTQSESQTQVQVQTRPASSRSASSAPVAQQQGEARTSGPNPPALVTAAPSPGQWYGIHALAASHQRVGSATALKGNINGKQPSQTQRHAAREAAHPYPPCLRQQRRSVSGPAVLTGAQAQVDPPAPLLGNVPSSSASLPSHSPVSTSSSSPAPTPGPPQVLSSGSSLPSVPRYLVRTDVHYDIQTNTVTTMLEIPGVPRAAIRIALGDDTRSGIRMLIVRGRMRRIAFPSATTSVGKEKGKEVDKNGEKEDEKENDDAGYVVKERKVGEFKRVLVVPQETEPEDIQVSLADGILFLRYPAGPQNIALSQTAMLNSPTARTAKSSVQQVEPALAPAQVRAPVPSNNGSSTPIAGHTQNQNPGGMQINFRVQTPATSSSSNTKRASNGN